MDGLLDYANIFAFWLHQLSIFWEFLNLPFVEGLTVAFALLRQSFINIPILTAFFAGIEYTILSAWEDLFNLLGLSDLTVLGFFFSILGSLFFVYFLFTIIQWFLRTIPVL